MKCRGLFRRYLCTASVVVVLAACFGETIRETSATVAVAHSSGLGDLTKSYKPEDCLHTLLYAPSIANSICRNRFKTSARAFMVFTMLGPSQHLNARSTGTNDVIANIMSSLAGIHTSPEDVNTINFTLWSTISSPKMTP